MKIALVSDLHIHNWREFSEPGEQGVPTRLGHCADVLADVGNYATDNEVTTVVIGGDIFHKRGVLYTQAYNLVVAHLSWMKDLGLTVLVVDGNHDHADKAGRVHAVEALSSAGLVRSIQPEYGFENWHLSSDDHSESMVITGVSYCDGMDAFERRLDKAEGEARADYDGEDRIFVFHHGFKDARVGTALEYQVKEEIDSKLLDCYEHDFAFSGHYHTRQSIGGRKNAVYIGSPLEHMRGDAGTVKGFLVYDTARMDYTLVPLKRPRFVTLTQKMIDEKDFSLVEGNFVDVAFETLPKKPDAFRDMLKEKHGALGINLAPRRKGKATATAARLDIDLSMDSKTILQKYITHTKSELDADELLRVGVELLDKAVS